MTTFCEQQSEDFLDWWAGGWVVRVLLRFPQYRTHFYSVGEGVHARVRGV